VFSLSHQITPGRKTQATCWCDDTPRNVLSRLKILSPFHSSKAGKTKKNKRGKKKERENKEKSIVIHTPAHDESLTSEQ